MEDNIDLVELFIDETDDKDGIFAISFVHEPAIEEDFIHLAQHEIKFQSINDDKRLVVGLALVPEKKILRVNKGKKFNVMFSKETVLKASHLYMKNLNLSNTTTNHESKVRDVTVVESWIINDTKNDKINTYGLKAVQGGWAVIFKVENDEVWQEVKNGTYKGFSVEGKFSDKLVEASVVYDDSVMTEKRAEELLKLNRELTEEEANEVLDLIKSTLA